MSEIDQQVGKRLRTARIASGFRSARAFSQKHNIPESTYSQHENGKRSLSPKMLILYAQRLSVSPGWLLSGLDDNMSESQAPTFGPISTGAAWVDIDLLTGIFSKTLPSLIEKNAYSDMRKVVDYCLALYNGMVAPATQKDLSEKFS